MKNLTTFTKDGVDVERLAQVIEEQGRPVHINVLAREAVRAFFATHGERLYAPGATYAVGEEIRLDGQPAMVRAVRVGGNPQQGPFTVLTLRLSDGSDRWMAAKVVGAPAEDRALVGDDEARQLMKGKDGGVIRRTVEGALDGDARFAWFQSVQGTYWCLEKLLREVGNVELAKVAAVLPEGLVNGEPQTESTEALVEAVWGVKNDGSDEYELAAFALGRALAAYVDLVEAGGRWMRSEAWDAFVKREALSGPRVPTNIELPPGVEKATPSKGPGKNDGLDDDDGILATPAEVEEDVEAWIANHPNTGTFVLKARHYHEAWLPLTKEVRRLFPPLEAGRQQVTLRLNLVGYQANVNAWVDLDERRIWGWQGLYDTLRAQTVYPGARLRLTHAGGDVYDLETRPVLPSRVGEKVQVWKIWLKDGEITGVMDPEPRRYDITDEVFVADARFDELPALFRQAEEAGNSIFGLMYKKAVAWWEAQGRQELRVTVQQLFEEIHYDEKGRMTHPATIAWELWRRAAFEAVGNGQYRFRPEHLDELKPAAVWGPAKVKPAAPKVGGKKQIKRTRKLPTAPRVESEPVKSTLWDEVRGDPAKWEKLEAAFEAYMADPAREGVLLIRGKAHERIRTLLAEDRLDELTVDEFNRHVWKIGKVTYRGATGWVDAAAVRTQLAGVDRAQLAEDFDAGQLTFEGNQTWGSASAIWGAALEQEYRADAALLRTNLRYLLYSDAAPLEARLGEVVKASNGFGMNSATGILHAMWPDAEVLYNGQSVAALQKLGVAWNEGWKGDTALYVRYRDFCRRMKEELGFESLTDVDWCMYNLKEYDLTEKTADLSLDEAFLLGLILGRGHIDRAENTITVSLQYGHYKDGYIRGAGVIVPEQIVLRAGADEVLLRLETLRARDSTLVKVALSDSTMYRYNIVLKFQDRSGLFGIVSDWYPYGDVYQEMSFPRAKLDKASAGVMLEFMRGYACATGLITDTTRAGPSGRHRVYIRAPIHNKEILNDVRWLLEDQLHVPVAGIHWHEGRDPQMRVYAEDFEPVGFGVQWQDAILKACAEENRRLYGPNPDQGKLFD